MKNPTLANPIQASSHLATAMNNVISSVFPEQAMEGCRPKTWVSQCHKLLNYMTDIFPLMPDNGQDLLLSPSSLNFKWKRVG